MATIEECNSPLDCVVKRDNNEEVRMWCFGTGNISENNKTGICNCFSYYGFTGEFCQDPSFQTLWTGIIHAIILILCLIGIIIAFRLGKRFFQLEKTVLNTNIHLVWALFHIILSLSFEFAFSLSAIFMVSDQKYLIHVEFKSLTEQAPDFITLLGPTDVYTQIISLYFFLLVSLNIIFFWLSVIQRVNKVLDQDKFNKVRLFKIIVAIIVSIVSIFAFIFMILGYFSSLTICAAGLAAPTVVFAWSARIMFIREIEKCMNGRTSAIGDKNLSAIIKKIRRFSLTLALSLSIIGALLLIYGEFGFDRMLETESGTFLGVQLPLQLVYLLKICVLLYTLYFINGIYEKLDKRYPNSKNRSSQQSATITNINSQRK